MAWRGGPVILAMCAALGLARAEEEKPGTPLDDEHIFGFTEGTDIGEKGERELEFSSTGSFGKHGAFAAIENETTFRYGAAEGFRASLGLLTDYHGIYDSPGLADRSAFAFSGLTTEFSFALMERDNALFGLTVSLAPQGRRRDADSGAPLENYSLPVIVLIDKALIPDSVFIAANITYAPNFSHGDGAWRTQNPVEISSAVSFAVTPGIFVGAEVRHLAQNQSGFFTGHGLYVGPSIFFKLSERATLKAVWSAQIPDESSHGLDLANYERHQVRVQFATSF